MEIPATFAPLLTRKETLKTEQKQLEDRRKQLYSEFSQIEERLEQIRLLINGIQVLQDDQTLYSAILSEITNVQPVQ